MKANEIQSIDVSQVTYCIPEYKNETIQMVLEGDKEEGKQIKIQVGVGATLQLIILQKREGIEELMSRLEIVQEKDSQVKLSIINIDQISSTQKVVIHLDGEGAKCDFKTVYLVDGERVLNLDYELYHRGERTSSDVVVKGALKDHATKVFNGNLHFVRGAKGANGSEVEEAILLDPKVISKSIPALWCDEDNIIGNHAASSGKLSKDKLFYLMSRGLTEGEAKTLMVEAQFGPVLEALEDEHLKDVIREEVARRLTK